MQRLTEADKKVIRVFLHGGKADGKKLWTDGRTLNGHWLGGSRIAYWEGSGPRLLNMPDTGSKTGDTIQRAVRRMFKEMTPNARKTRTKSKSVPPHLKRAVEFFYKHAGWSYDPKAETPEQGRRCTALELAEAEHEATQRGWTVTWEDDPEPYETDDETYVPKEVLGAVLRDEHGKVLQSLWSIADPSRSYARVIEAELALEELG